MSLRRRWIIALGALSVCLASLPGNYAQEPPLGPAAPKDTAALTRTGARKTAVVAAIERVKGAVVNIHSERNATQSASDLFPPNLTNKVNGMGTGIIIDPRGYIVTNQHVVDDVTSLRIRLADGSAHGAVVIARHPELDLAIIKINPPYALPVMPIGTASDLMVGETVIAIGNAYGYEHTASLGIVSAKNRDVSLNKEMSYKSLIQTDAPINPGNSGGPLINTYGDCIGVNVAIRAGAQSIGFAIPVDHMVRSVSEMMKARRRGTVHDGLTARDILLPGNDGLVRKVIVDRVDAGSPAEAAGLKSGDVLVQIGDVAIASGIDVERALMDRKSGETIAFVVRRKDQEQNLRVALADLVWQRLGLQLTPVNGVLVSRANNQLRGGLEVTAINAGGAAAKAGILKGDILVGLHGLETLNQANVTYVLNHAEFGVTSAIPFFIVRAGQMQRGQIQQNQ